MKKIFLGSLTFVFLILVIIGFTQKTKPYGAVFSKDFYYAYEQKAIFGNDKLSDIPPTIKKYTSDKDYVLVIQNPKYNKDDMYDCNDSMEYKNGLNSDYYWIIDLKSKMVYGPFLYDEFLIQIVEKHIHDDLLLKLLNAD